MDGPNETSPLRRSVNVEISQFSPVEASYAIRVSSRYPLVGTCEGMEGPEYAGYPETSDLNLDEKSSDEFRFDIFPEMGGKSSCPPDIFILYFHINKLQEINMLYLSLLSYSRRFCYTSLHLSWNVLQQLVVKMQVKRI